MILRVRILRLLLVSCLASCTGTATPSSSHGGKLPNLVVIFLDDAGYADIGATGAPYPTPNLDRLVDEGTLLTSFYVAHPVCSASRVALLTGCYADRVGIPGVLFPSDSHGLSSDEVSLAEIAQAAGYRTGIFGKWHLGDDAPFLPTEHGFDEFAGLPYSHDMWPARSPEYPPLPFYEGTTKVIADLQLSDQETLTRRLTEHATSFIDRNAEHPFFLYIPHPQPHVPLFASESFRGVSGLGPYADVMMELDWSVGEILRALEAHELTEHTWVLVASDNGPWLSYGDHAGSAAPFRDGKHTVFEGGVRVFGAMRYPGRIPAGRVLVEPVMTIDILPTFANLVGAALPEHPIDGRDVWPILAGEPDATSPHEAYYLWYESRLQAVLQGRFKLHLPHGYTTVVAPGAGGEPGTLETAEQPLALYDLANDPGESIDVGREHQDVADELMRLGAEHDAELRDNARGPGWN